MIDSICMLSWFHFYRHSQNVFLFYREGFLEGFGKNRTYIYFVVFEENSDNRKPLCLRSDFYETWNVTSIDLISIVYNYKLMAEGQEVAHQGGENPNHMFSTGAWL